MGRQMKVYTLYDSFGVDRPSPRVADHYVGPKAGRRIYAVRAWSMKQARELVEQKIWAAGPDQIGMIRLEINRDSGPNEIQYAPYCEKERG